MSIDIEELRKREQAATPGPWTVNYDEDENYSITPTGRWMDGVAWASKSADAELMAHAREDVPALLDEVERLRGAAQTLGKIIEDQSNDALAASGVVGVIGEDGDGDWGLVWEALHALRPRAERAEAERDRLRAAVDAVWDALANDRPDGRRAGVRLPWLRGEIRSAIEEHLGEEG